MSPRDDTAIEGLLRETATAHHEAFRATDGADPEWPLWYATYLAERLPRVSSFMGSRSELVYWLVRLDREYQAGDSAIPWERFYATRIAAL
jgi:NAD(P)H-hydrate epimerase